MPSKRFQPGTASLEELFARGSPLLRVPRYQRRYAWNNRQEVAQLWQDVLDAVERDADEYFLGTIVLDRTPQGILEVIDGQQRLATLTMMLGGLRNKLATLGATYSNASQASSKLNELIMRTDLLGQPQDAVLTLGVYDQDSFRRYVQLRPGESGHLALDATLPQSRPGRPPTNRVKEAFKQITESVESLTKQQTPEDQVRKLARLAEYILGRVTHITITVTEDSDAFTLFETVNYRGLDLSTADLLKNHVFGLASSDQQIEELTGLWTALVSSLEDSQITRFLRYVWLSRHRYVTEKELYPSIKEHIKTNAIDPRDFLADLNDDALTFTNLGAPKDDDPCALELRDLSAMRMTLGMPFLMAAKDKLDERGFKRAVRVVETLSVRNTLVGKRNPNELERRFGDWARQFRTGSNFSDVADDAKKVSAPDNEFRDGFKELSELSSAQARCLLRKIEWHRDVETQIAPAGVDIEHILPQSPNEHWTEYMGGTEEEVLAASQRLGNLTLLSERLNKKAAAKPFLEKRDNFYAKSKIKMTNALVSYDHRTYDIIASRRAELAEKAVEIWRL
jgi:hypothetical protein